MQACLEDFRPPVPFHIILVYTSSILYLLNSFNRKGILLLLKVHLILHWIPPMPFHVSYTPRIPFKISSTLSVLLYLLDSSSSLLYIMDSSSSFHLSCTPVLLKKIYLGLVHSNFPVLLQFSSIYLVLIQFT